MPTHFNPVHMPPPPVPNRRQSATASGSRAASTSAALEKVPWPVGKEILRSVEREWKSLGSGRSIDAFADAAGINRGDYTEMRNGERDLTTDIISDKIRKNNLDPKNQLRPYDAKSVQKRKARPDNDLDQGPSAPPQTKSRRRESAPPLEFGASPLELNAQNPLAPISVDAQGQMSPLLARAADKYRDNVIASDMLGKWPDFGINSQAFRLAGDDVREAGELKTSYGKYFEPTQLDPDTSVVFYNIVDPANTRALVPSAADEAAKRQHLIDTGALTLLYHPPMNLFFALDPEHPDRFQEIKHPNDADR